MAEAAQAALTLMSRRLLFPFEERLLFPIDAQGHATVPEGETEIGDSAFENCHSLVLTILPGGLVSIDKHAFRGCHRLALTRSSERSLSLSCGLGGKTYFEIYNSLKFQTKRRGARTVNYAGSVGDDEGGGGVGDDEGGGGEGDGGGGEGGVKHTTRENTTLP